MPVPYPRPGSRLARPASGSRCSPGVAYVGGYQGAPISHLMDVLGDAHEHPVRDLSRIVLPPASFLHEREREHRWPAAVRFIRERRLDEVFGDGSADIGIITQGGLYNTLNRGSGDYHVATKHPDLFLRRNAAGSRWPARPRPDNLPGTWRIR